MHAKKHDCVGLTTGALLGLLLHAVSPPLAAAGLGARLGAADVRSLFGEPLRARIPIALPSGVSLDALTVRLAGDEGYRAMGLDPDAFISRVRVRLESIGTAPFVTIETTAPLREPALALVLEVRTRDEMAYQVVDMVLDGVPASAPRGTPGPAPVVGAGDKGYAPGRPTPTGDAPAASAPPATYGPTGRYDTLYGIASRVRPDRSVSIREMAMALFHANPHAFFDDNINNLRLGVILKIPTRLEPGSTARAERAFVHQMQMWRVSRGAASAEPTPDPAPAPEPAREHASARASLLAEERAARARLEPPNTALQERAQRLDEHIATIRALLVRQNERIATLQDQAERIEARLRARAPSVLAAAGSEPAPLTSALPSGAAAGPAPSLAAPEPVAATPPLAGALARAAPRAGPASAAVVDRSTHTSAHRAPPVDASAAGFVSAVLRRLVDTVGSVGLLVSAAVLMAGLAVWMTVGRAVRRAKPGMDDRRYWQKEDGLRSKVSQKAAKALDLEAANVPRRRGARGGARTALRADTRGAAHASAFDPEVAVAPTTDAMHALFREVDVYVAYGRFPDAIARLQQAIYDAPTQHELRGKLAEVLFEAGDAAAYLELGQTLHPRLMESGGEALWARVALLGHRLMPEEGLFEQSVARPAVGEGEGDLGGVDELSEWRSRRG